MDREFSDELTSLMPVVPHGISGVVCNGRIAAFVEDSNVELRCNQCGATVGVVQVNVMEGLLGLDCEDDPPGIDDDTCRWYTFENEEPIAVMCCVCGRQPAVDEEGVSCLCGRRSRIRARGMIAAITAWNQMSGPGLNPQT